MKPTCYLPHYTRLNLLLVIGAGAFLFPAGSSPRTELWVRRAAADRTAGTGTNGEVTIAITSLQRVRDGITGRCSLEWMRFRPDDLTAPWFSSRWYSYGEITYWDADASRMTYTESVLVPHGHFFSVHEERCAVVQLQFRAPPGARYAVLSLPRQGLVSAPIALP
jgi:hypothetical protein